jgi:hypothetical protein
MDTEVFNKPVQIKPKRLLCIAAALVLFALVRFAVSEPTSGAVCMAVVFVGVAACLTIFAQLLNSSNKKSALAMNPAGLSKDPKECTDFSQMSHSTKFLLAAGTAGGEHHRALPGSPAPRRDLRPLGRNCVHGRRRHHTPPQ